MYHRENNRVKGFILSLFLVMASICQTEAQILDVGAELGGCFYQGDLSTEKVLTNLGQSGIAANIFLRCHFHPRIALKLQGSYGQIQAHDHDSDRDWQIERDLNFKTSIYDLGLQLEGSFIDFRLGKGQVLTPIVFAGGSIFWFNPKGEYLGEWHDLRELGTEGQGLPQYPDRPIYDKKSSSIILGVGTRYHINQRISWNVNLSFRRGFTDYLDDVSNTYVTYELLEQSRGTIAAELGNGIRAEEGYRRGNGNVNDWFVFFTTGVSVNLGTLSSIFSGSFDPAVDCYKF